MSGKHCTHPACPNLIRIFTLAIIVLLSMHDWRKRMYWTHQNHFMWDYCKCSHNSRCNGYALLKAILATTLMVHLHDLGQLSTPPTAHPGVTPYDFTCSLNDFYRGQQQFNRTYTPRECAMMFLQGMANDPDGHAADYARYTTTFGACAIARKIL